MTFSKDLLYADENAPEPEAFRFDERVANVFQDMIQRSVPGYATIIEGTQAWARLHAAPGTTCYDLGCSLGASTLAILFGAVDPTALRIVAVDSSAPMLERCRDNVARTFPQAHVEYVCDDMRNVDFQPGSLFCLNFTLQFLPLAERAPLLARIRRALLPAGALVLAEKLHSTESVTAQQFQRAHETFKLQRGYSDLEVARKRAALENVLLPETLGVHQARLRSCGFARSVLWFRCFQFCSLVATP